MANFAPTVAPTIGTSGFAWKDMIFKMAQKSANILATFVGLSVTKTFQK